MMERKKNILEIRKLFEKRKETLRLNAELARFLMAKGIARGIVEEICQELSSIDETEEDLVPFLCHSLASRLKTLEGIQWQKKKPTVVALVGPTGVGKTTTVLKLARFYRSKGKKVGLISLDEEKGGALLQLQKEAELLEVPLKSGWEKIGDLKECDLVLIDTTGCNFYQPNRVDKLGERLFSCGLSEIHLTLSAAAKDVDLYGAIHQFSVLPIKSLIFTKLDETLAPGVLINVCTKMELPISYVTYGYPLPGEIQMADPMDIIHKILTEKNEKEFHFLRQLTILEN